MLTNASMLEISATWSDAILIQKRKSVKRDLWQVEQEPTRSSPGQKQGRGNILQQQQQERSQQKKIVAFIFVWRWLSPSTDHHHTLPLLPILVIHPLPRAGRMM